MWNNDCNPCKVQIICIHKINRTTKWFIATFYNSNIKHWKFVEYTPNHRRIFAKSPSNIRRITVEYSPNYLHNPTTTTGTQILHSSNLVTKPHAPCTVYTPGHDRLNKWSDVLVGNCPVGYSVKSTSVLYPVNEELVDNCT